MDKIYNCFLCKKEVKHRPFTIGIPGIFNKSGLYEFVHFCNEGCFIVLTESGKSIRDLYLSSSPTKESTKEDIDSIDEQLEAEYEISENKRLKIEKRDKWGKDRK